MIVKCLFPVAGYGTRFLPATKSMPKEMLPIVNKPLVQYGVEEAIEAGLDGLFDSVLNQRFVHNWEHFLGHALGRGQESGTVARNWKQAFNNHVGVSSLPYTSSNRTISSSPRYEPDCTSITSSGTAPRFARRCFIPIGI